MTKQVHFAPTNVAIVYYPAPPTPSPVLTDSSLPSDDSSSGPETPPQTLLEVPSPSSPQSKRLPLPQGQGLSYSDHLSLHILLAWHPLDPVPEFWDLRTPPTELAQKYPKILNEPATRPPLDVLTVHCPHFDWTFKIVPSPSRKPGVVKLGDVWLSLWRHLRVPLTQTEYAKLRKRDKVNEAYHARCDRIQDGTARKKERAKGVKRIDVLKGRTKFLGFAGSTLDGKQIWLLKVDHL